MELQEAGRKSGYLPPRVLMERIPDQVRAQLVENAEESPFYIAFTEMPDTIDADDQARLRRAIFDTDLQEDFGQPVDETPAT
jgi:uncharacterized protein (DUF885 family)